VEEFKPQIKEAWLSRGERSAGFGLKREGPRRFSIMYIVSAEMNIERTRQLAREQAIQGLVCLPSGVKKYVGFITICHQWKSGIMSYSS